jgi:hypothetical protein
VTSLIPPFPEGRIQQLGYVVEDLEESVEKFSAMFGIKRFFVWENLAAEVTEKTYRGQSADFQFSCAFGYSGDMMIELIRHDSGESIFKEWLDSRGPGLHHVCFLLSGLEQYEETVAGMAAHGHSVAMSGRSGDARFSYADTVGDFGVFTELAYGPPEFLASFDRIKSGDF